jgi:hypothetical protein
MIAILRSLPQGMFWYPLLAFLAFGFVRVVLSVSRQFRSPKSAPAGGSDPLISLAGLVDRAQTDNFARMELERHMIGLLLQVNGFTGYSVESCRSFVASLPANPAADEQAAAIESHLTDSQRGTISVGASGSGLSARVETILEAVERITEAPGG